MSSAKILGSTQIQKWDVFCAAATAHARHHDAGSSTSTLSSAKGGIFLIKTLILLLCLLASGNMRAQGTDPVGERVGYVFYSGGTNGEYLANDKNGTTTFSPTNCIWAEYTSQKYSNGSKYLKKDDIITSNSGEATKCTRTGSESGTTGQKLKYADENFLHYKDGGWTKNKTGSNVVFSVTKYAYPLVSEGPVVSIDRTEFSEEGESGEYSRSDAHYRSAYWDYVFYNNTHHYFSNETSGSISAVPAEETFTYTWTWEVAPESGHVSINPSTGEVTYDHYFTTDTELRLKLTAQSSNRTFTAYSPTLTFLAPKDDPTSVSAPDMTLYVGNSQTAGVILTPTPCYINLEFSSDNTDIATVSSDGVVTGVAVGQTIITIKAYKIDNTNYVSNTFNVTVKNKVATPEISFEPNDNDNGATATASITCTTEGAIIRYTDNGDDPTSTSGIYTASFQVSDGQTVKTLAIKEISGWDNSDVAELTYMQRVLPTPEIEIISGIVTITCGEPDVTLHYTTNGDEPTASSPVWDGSDPTGLTNECTIKVIATKSGWTKSNVASRQYIQPSGVSGTTVILNDYEDHNWSYYAGVDDFAETVAANKYNTRYLGKIYSPDPRNVKITYKGGGVSGASSVAISKETNENQNEMVYYKTLEKFVIGEFTDTDNDGVPDNYSNATEQYPYTVISNPFSKRPRTTGTTGTNGFYGFGGWKVTKGWKYIKRANGNTATENEVLSLDEKIHFINLDQDVTYTPNCTSAEIEFEATWVTATVKTGSSAQSFTGGTYETNFLVITTNTTTSITQNSPCTITGIYPDGTGDIHSINGVTAGANNVKVEWVKSGSGNWNANAYHFTIGRGVTTTATSNTQSVFSGTSDNGNCANIQKIESGTYGRLYFYRNNGTATTSNNLNIQVVLGCDYDRARAHPENEDDPYTNKLILHRADINGGSSGYNLNRGAGQLYWRGVFKSGKHIGEFGEPLASESSYAGKSAQHFYCSAHENIGHRFLTIEGGRINGVTGGSDGDNSYQIGNRAFTLRIKGNACILGCLVGAASSNPGSGDRAFAITGGKIGGWIAGGANGTSDNGGTTIGNSYIYIGGNAQVDSKLFYTPHTLNHSYGGIIYGAGCGISAGKASGSMEVSTNVVVADNAYIERAIYGGGAYGRAANVSGDSHSTVTDVPANIYILGGHVGGVDGTNDTGEKFLKGGVYGGASLNNGCSSNIYQYGGIVEGGIYGGSNADGTMDNNVNIQILGGQVGTTSNTTNIHGGGYGASTRVTGNVDITLGARNTSGETSGSAVVYGDVYGGSALGYVNGTTTSTSKHTKVTVNGGDVYGTVYGGGLGDNTNAADVYAPVTVTINGGSATNVFGCNNTNGRPTSTVHVKMTGGLVRECVYGGGNLATYTGTPHVWISGGTVNKHVFGGGLGAAINGSTDVIVIGSETKIGQNVYGGGNEGQISNNTKVQIGGSLPTE